MLAVFAEFEREVLRDRVKAGIAAPVNRANRLDDRPPLDYLPARSRPFTEMASVRAKSHDA